ncbi:septal ring lytic transglycosylase RlpA family protein [Sphingomonas sp.]|jgi:rare lipoprotein A|uniref:septal ring lytic transglycosylase RlpA family protein n=1 Tax=Sphingomonas sp. TaxID=28214 RepID=UPI002E33E444|nr:RlpA-like double-psi beta-barrel domain-containing protein [Sphingomonas sp.]HEX4693765.1 RlpA-like double-psi beta-barrel domain-containing protein [Sphingomonas sp.]
MRLNNKAIALVVGMCVMGSAAAQDRPSDPAAGGPPPSNAPSGTSDRSPDRYDQVGYASGEAGGNSSGFTVTHRTLPLGSFVEVTSLDTGRTILVTVTDRGPTQDGLLIGLSPAAAKALGLDSRVAVRVRRVTPTPADQNALRNGQQASDRLDTPPALLTGLRAQLSGQPSVANPPQIAVATSPVTRPPRALLSPKSPPASPPPASAPAITGHYFVQIAAFGSKDRATAVAKGVGGTASPFKSLWRVRTGPFADAKKAAQARDAAAARGYGDARVVRED